MSIEADRIVLGRTLQFTANPFHSPPENSVKIETSGAIGIRDGRICFVNTEEIPKDPECPVDNFVGKLLLPGFVDAHVHYPQTRIIASWGKRLIDWLNSYTFPEEMRFGDPAYAKAVANDFFDIALSHGVTTSASFCTIHPESVDAYFEAAQQRGLLAIGGKVMMDRNAPEGLRDTAQSGYDASKTLIEKWQGQGRLHYAISPRFAPTSTSEQLEAAGSLWQEHPGCLVQTHLAEQKEEIAWVAELFPDHPDYLSVYESFGLSAPGAVFGHSIHLDDKMWQRLRERGASVAHCPTSNSFIGSGLFNALAAQKAGVPVGLATDTGGGSSFSMLRTMAAAYEIAQLGGTALHPYQLLWMATAGSAEALCQQDKIGRIEVGMDADLVVLDLQATTEITQRAERANSLSEELFPTIMLGDDRSIHQVYVAGRPVKL